MDEESIIRDRLEDMRTLGEVAPGEQPLESAARAKKLAKYFHKEVEFSFKLEKYGSLRLMSRAAVQQRILAARRQLKSLEIAFEDLWVEVKGDIEATVELTVTTLGSMPKVDGQFLERHRILITLTKVDDNWEIFRTRHLRNERESERL